MALRRMKSAQQRRERGTAGASVNGGDATAPPQTLGVVARIECKAGVRQSAKTAILYRTENMRLDAMQSLNPNYLGESRLAMEFRQSLFNTGRLWSRRWVDRYNRAGATKAGTKRRRNKAFHHGR